VNQISDIFLPNVTGDALGEAGDVFRQLAEVKDNLVSASLLY
jgi:hypothetical protein